MNFRKNKNLIMADFRKRHSGVFLNDGLAADYVLNDIQNFLTEVSSTLCLKSLNLPRRAERCYHIETDDQEHPADMKNIDSTALNTNKFNKDQNVVFNTIVVEILPGLIADNLHAPVQRLVNYQSACSRTYFLDAPDGTGKTFNILTIQAILKACKHSIIAVATSVVAASLSEHR